MTQTPKQPNSLRAALLGGLLPLIIYTVAEETLGILWGLILGMVFGVMEILIEYVRYKKVEAITLGGNALLLVLGSVSLLTQEGTWFRLQPAILEAVMGLVLMISVWMGKPLLVAMARKQGTLERVDPTLRQILEKSFSGFTFRCGVFFLIFASVTAWAALYWSTRAWVALKGIGFTAGFLLYALLEMFFLRLRLKR